jgi:hypothetical protein
LLVYGSFKGHLEMRIHVTLCMILLAGSGCAIAAKLYKWTDEQGNVVYSDTPRPGAVEIEVHTEPAGIVPVPPGATPAEPPAPAAGGYDSLIIAAPADQAVLEDPEGRVGVSLALAPALQTDAGHAIQLRLDGRALETRYAASEIVLTDVERGEHVVQAEVVDANGTVLIASAAVTFVQHRPSELAPHGPDIYSPAVPPPPYPPVYPPVRPTPRTR